MQLQLLLPRRREDVGLYGANEVVALATNFTTRCINFRLPLIDLGLKISWQKGQLFTGYMIPKVSHALRWFLCVNYMLDDDGWQSGISRMAFRTTRCYPPLIPGQRTQKVSFEHF